MTPTQAEMRARCLYAAEYAASNPTVAHVLRDPTYSLSSASPAVQAAVAAVHTALQLSPTPAALAAAFCRTPLPPTVRADLCATTSYPHPRSGTNLMSLAEAEVFMADVLAAACGSRA